MSTIYLLRHGHVDNPNQIFYDETFPLSLRGRREIERVGEMMLEQKIHIERIFSSPFLRTRQTSEIIQKIFPTATLSFDERLAEWKVNGWFGKSLEDFYRATGYHDTPPRMDDPNVESLSEMANRVILFIQQTVLPQTQKASLIVSHREPLVSAILTLQHRSFDEIHDVDFPVACLWKCEFDELGNFLEAKRLFAVE